MEISSLEVKKSRLEEEEENDNKKCCSYLPHVAVIVTDLNAVADVCNETVANADAI